MPRPVLTFARFVATGENRAAWLAMQDLAAHLGSRAAVGEGKATHGRISSPPLLMLHGPPGSGKSHLVHALVAEVTGRHLDLVVSHLAARDLVQALQPTLFSGESVSEADTEVDFEEARHCDLLIVEDLQHLPPRAAEKLVQVLDHLHQRRRPAVLTANAGPARLNHRGERFSARLTSRLAAGLIVALEPLGPASRLALLQTFAQRRQLAVPTEALRWLADHLAGGGRQLEGAIARLEALAKLHRHPLDVATIETEFREQTEAGAVTVSKIAERVGGYFRVEPSALQSRRRYRKVLIARQVGMYLARKLTVLSLEEIGDFFGGRDHSTVLHACKKVEHALDRDAVLSGAVREIHAELA